MKAKWYRRLAVVPMAALSVQLVAPSAGATHSWGTFHWARTSPDVLTLQLGNNLSSAWASPATPYLTQTATDWSKSTVLDTEVGRGGSNPKRCSPTAGRVEVCNSTYGRNGWLGIASVWASADHITQATVKLNDTYFNTARYNTPSWRNFVMCQEVGHTLGLGHTDETFDNANEGTCMDYTNNPAGDPNGPNGSLNNERPNLHDYAQLESIYNSHSNDGTTTVASSASSNAVAADLNRRDQWGMALRYDSKGRGIVFGRELAPGETVFTFVVWADEHDHH